MCVVLFYRSPKNAGLHPCFCFFLLFLLISPLQECKRLLWPFLFCHPSLLCNVTLALLQSYPLAVLHSCALVSLALLHSCALASLATLALLYKSARVAICRDVKRTRVQDCKSGKNTDQDHDISTYCHSYKSARVQEWQDWQEHTRLTCVMCFGLGTSYAHHVPSTSHEMHNMSLHWRQIMHKMSPVHCEACIICPHWGRRMQNQLHNMSTLGTSYAESVWIQLDLGQLNWIRVFPRPPDVPEIDSTAIMPVSIQIDPMMAFCNESENFDVTLD